MPDREHTLYLLDGMALVYRAHFAFATNPIRTAAGRNTSAIYGFTNTLLELITKQKPTHLAVVFDTAAPTARHKEFPAYKAQREEMPEELSAAIPDVKRLIRAFNFPVLELDGYEADDIIGTLAREACAGQEKYTTYMVTPDKDFGQLVNDCVHIYRPGRMGDDAEILGVPEVLAKWGIARCDQVRDILGFAGDTSDNIPGIPGIGEKTAQKLIAQYDTLENTLDHFAEQKGKLKESLQKFATKRSCQSDWPRLTSTSRSPSSPKSSASARATSRRSRRCSPSSNSTPSAAASSAMISRPGVELPR